MNSITAYLESHHTRCDDIFTQVEAAVAAGQWPQAVLAMQRFEQATGRHFCAEETILFPAFENAIGSTAGPTRVMRFEHLNIRGILRTLAEAIRQHNADDFFAQADTLNIMLHQHNLKEESMLYPMAEQLLCNLAEDIVASLQAFDESDAEAADSEALLQVAS